MSWKWMMVLALGALGCRSATPASAPPTPPPADSDPAPRQAASSPAPRPLTTGATDFYFRVAPAQIVVGDDPNIALVAGSSLPSTVDGTVEAVLTKPDGTELTHEVFVGSVESTRYCLPKGHPCQHSRRVEPFHRAPLSFGSGRSVFDEPGRYRLDLRSPRFAADTVEIVVRR